MSGMDDLIAFLRARLDEDEAEARAAGHAQLHRMSQRGNTVIADAGFIQRFTPDRVLAEVDAKRQIIDLASEASGLDMQVDGERRIGPRDEVAEPYVGDLILRHLATPYADHPSFKEEWRV